MTETPPLLPDFIIIGAMKCGTTTLYRHLAGHPGIDMSRDKETDFFVAEKNWSRGLEWYGRQFTHSDRIRGEASPNYTKARDFAGVPERIAQVCPDVRLIYIVRDPMTRAESQFRHSFLMGNLSGLIDDFEGSDEYAHVLDASLYARQLAAYHAHFPQKAILVLDFDDLVRDPQAVMDRVCDHIGAERHEIVDSGAQNDSAELSRIPAPLLRFGQSRPGRFIAGFLGRGFRNRLRRLLSFGRARRAEEFPEDLKQRLKRDIAPDAARFREMTERDFNGWQV